MSRSIDRHLPPDPLGECLASCFRRLLAQVDVDVARLAREKITPIAPETLGGEGVIGVSGSEPSKDDSLSLPILSQHGRD